VVAFKKRLISHDIIMAEPGEKNANNKNNEISGCTHKSSRWPEGNWFFLSDNVTQQGLANHPHCIYCGTIKNISSDRAKSLGYYTGILGRMKELKKIQVRLISNELQAYDEFNDTYAQSKTWQIRIFIDIVKKHANISEQAIVKYL